MPNIGPFTKAVHATTEVVLGSLLRGYEPRHLSTDDVGTRVITPSQLARAGQPDVAPSARRFGLFSLKRWMAGR